VSGVGLGNEKNQAEGRQGRRRGSHSQGDFAAEALPEKAGEKTRREQHRTCDRMDL
jgi:hypothetical protein